MLDTFTFSGGVSENNLYNNTPITISRLQNEQIDNLWFSPKLHDIIYFINNQIFLFKSKYAFNEFLKEFNNFEIVKISALRPLNNYKQNLNCNFYNLYNFHNLNIDYANILNFHNYQQNLKKNINKSNNSLLLSNSTSDSTLDSTLKLPKSNLIKPVRNKINNFIRQIVKK